jgi:hypothetical protein
MHSRWLLRSFRVKNKAMSSRARQRPSTRAQNRRNHGTVEILTDRLLEGWGVLLAVAAVWLTLALLTYTPADHSMNNAAAAAVIYYILMI